jgi:tRNA threonylcarbamoyladenosine biosynthesis protein TsaE
MKSVTIESTSEAATDALGRALAEALPDGAIVALDGPLGAGKTRLVQAIAAAAGVDAGAAVSPTFVLVQEYHGRRTIIHIDAYRLCDEDEFLALGGEELLATDSLVLIEWAVRISGALPRERLDVEIRETGETSREFTIVAHGPRFEPLVERLARTFGGAP